MRTIFMGTPDFAVPSLEELLNSDHKILSVITQPDRPKGRHLHLQHPPVKTFAQKNNLIVLQPADLNANSFKEEIINAKPEVIIVVAYGRIVPKWILSVPPYGCINVHASLLPDYRGAAPIQRAIMEGRNETGITTMLLDEGMDTGDILLQLCVGIEDDDTYGVLAKKLSTVGAKLLLKTLTGIVKGQIAPQKQDEDNASYAPKIEKEESLLDWSRPSLNLRNLIRALNPFPGAYTYLNGSRLKVWEARIAEGFEEKMQEAGSVIGLEDDGIVVAAVDKPLVLTIVQPENKRKMTASELLCGHPIQIGEKLG